MARRSQTKTNNSTSQGKHKTAETSEPTTIPPAKTRTYHCATGRQTDRQTDQKPSANYGKTLLKRLLWPISRCSTWIQKKLRNVESCNYARKSPPAMNLPKPILSKNSVSTMTHHATRTAHYTPLNTNTVHHTKTEMKTTPGQGNNRKWGEEHGSR